MKHAVARRQMRRCCKLSIVGRFSYRHGVMIRSAFWMAMLVCCAAAQMNGPTEPVCRAAWQGDIARAGAVLSAGASPNARDESGQTPLMHAVSVIRRPGTDSPKPVKRDYQAVASSRLDTGA